MEKQPYLYLDDVVRYTGIRKGTIKRLIKDNKIPYKKVGRDYIFVKFLIDPWYQNFMGGNDE